MICVVSPQSLVASIDISLGGALLTAIDVQQSSALASVYVGEGVSTAQLTSAVGAQSDVAFAGGATGTVIGLLKAIWTKLIGILSVSVPPLAYTICTSALVTAASGVLVAAGAVTRSLTITTPQAGGANIWLNVTGGAAVVGQGLVIWAGGSPITFGGSELPIPTAQISAISDGASVTVMLAGG